MCIAEPLLTTLIEAYNAQADTDNVLLHSVRYAYKRHLAATLKNTAASSQPNGELRWVGELHWVGNCAGWGIDPTNTVQQQIKFKFHSRPLAR